MSGISEAASSRGRLILYWVTTVLVALALVLGGAMEIRLDPGLVEGMAKLGYPAYFCVILGVWKVLGAAALLFPGTPRLKEWAYAGIVFDLTGADISHLAMQDDPSKVVAPTIILLLAVASWASRPASRRIPGPSLLTL